MNSTILAADVAGYGRLTSAGEEGTMRQLRALRAELIDPASYPARFRSAIIEDPVRRWLIEEASLFTEWEACVRMCSRPRWRRCASITSHSHRGVPSWRRRVFADDLFR